MTTPGKKFLVLIVPLSLCSCAQLDIPQEDLGIPPDQTEPILRGEGIRVPQTLEPSPRIESEENSGPKSIAAYAEPASLTTQVPTPQPITDLQKESVDSQASTSPSTSVTESVFGEFSGVSHQ